MAVIPPDAGVRMRMQAEASLVQQLQPVRAIPGDLPDIQPGQAFTARVLETLPDNTYKALVAGRQLTLQLPEGAETGDSLELILVDRTARTLIARRAEPLPAGAADQPYPFSKISTAGRMIGQLLPREGETPQPATLNRGEPLLARPPASAAELAPVLAKAVSQSGLFYESHQAQWLAGQRPLDSLRSEPQGRLPAPPRPATTGAPTQSEAAPVVGHEGEPPVSAPGGTASETGTTMEARSMPRTEAAPAGIPDEVRPLVQQQLDAVATQRLAWHGEAWPGQGIDWKIERDATDDHAAAQGDEAPRWTTTLRLTLPRLGAIDARLHLSGAGLTLRFAAAQDGAVDTLRAEAGELTRAMADAGLTVTGLDVRHEAT